MGPESRCGVRVRLMVEVTLDHEPSRASTEVWRIHNQAIIDSFETFKHMHNVKVVDKDPVVEIFEVKG